jgi:hypothetical protein
MNARLPVILLLGGLALLAPVANLLGIKPLQGLAAATGASPAMKVFTSHDGYETFSPRFHLEWVSANERLTLTLTPEVYAQIRGPYNRRNAYGAALAYSPVLTARANTQSMHASVVRYAFCDPAPLIEELKLGDVDSIKDLTVTIEPRRPLDPKWELEFEVKCDVNE